MAAAAASGLPAHNLSPQELQALQQTLQQHHHTLQQQLQQYVLFHPGAGSQAQFYIQNQVYKEYILIINI